MLRLILSIITSILVTALIVSLFFYFKIYRRWKRFISEEERKRDLEMEYIKLEIEAKTRGEDNVKEV